MAVYLFPANSREHNPPLPAPDEMNKSVEKALDSLTLITEHCGQELSRACTGMIDLKNMVKLLTDVARDVEASKAELVRCKQAVQEQRVLDEELYGESSSEDSYRFAVNREVSSILNVEEIVKAVGNLRKII
jgi:hypothetical protein